MITLALTVGKAAPCFHIKSHFCAVFRFFVLVFFCTVREHFPHDQHGALGAASQLSSCQLDAVIWISEALDSKQMLLFLTVFNADS